ncbi:MAG TPA: DUF2934 domain-containing protein [Terriglobales bacterium]|nr:DUF2934 domain-containing protein [Terriglobales bacterium]
MENSAEEKAVAVRKGNNAALKEIIAQRARELYESRGREEGHALEDWLRAEAEVMANVGAPQKPPDEPSRVEPARIPPRTPSKPAFFNVRVDDVIYTVQYDPEGCDSYRPGMLKNGQPVELRFEDDRIFMKLPNSKELEAKVVKKGQA